MYRIRTAQRLTLRAWHGAVAVAVAVLVAGAGSAVQSDGARAASLDQLNSQLGAQQARQQSLSASLGRLARLISALNGQIALVESREAAVQAELAHDRAELAAVHASLIRERALLALLRRRLSDAQRLLGRQLVSSYEGDRPDLVSVVLNANGFNDLLEQLDFLRHAEHEQQSIISITRRARARATVAAHRLARLEKRDQQIAEAALLHVRALAGMNALLHSRQDALAQARAAQQAALAASRERGQHLQAEIDRIQAAQAAAARAAAASSVNVPAASGPALGPGAGWAIPYSIVLCESGGQNLPPNWAGASGYYQIIPSTWAMFGGAGPAAYLTSKAEQDAVATRIWNGGAGAVNWDCAKIVGIIH